MSTEITQKPYLIRALWSWCSDQGHTPQIMVLINEHTRVPKGFDDEGRIVLDISMEATQGLELGNEWISFQARFGDVAHQIDVPIGQISAIFSAESGQGMGFEVSELEIASESSSQPQPEISKVTEVEKVSSKPKRSPLKIVK